VVLERTSLPGWERTDRRDQLLWWVCKQPACRLWNKFFSALEDAAVSTAQSDCSARDCIESVKGPLNCRLHLWVAQISQVASVVKHRQLGRFKRRAKPIQVFGGQEEIVFIHDHADLLVSLQRGLMASQIRCVRELVRRMQVDADFCVIGG